jgi:hypothetical protein
VFPIDNFRGAQIFGSGGGYYDARVTREMPRIFMYGGMLSYTIKPTYKFFGSQLINGDQVRISGIYTPDKYFTGPNHAQSREPQREQGTARGRAQPCG